MTAVEKYHDPAREGSSIELAPAAWGLAQKIAGTEFVPAGLRGKPEAVMACMLYGREAGVGEMNALAKIHVVDGRPGMAAELMRALVFQHGHELWIEETSSTRCIVGGKRRDSSRETRVTWTIEDAKRAGLEGRQNWRKYPDAMLLARATAKLCRAVFPDVLAGLSYTLEELADGDVPEEVLEGTVVEQGSEEAAAPEPKKPTARARRAATRGSDAPEETEPAPTPTKTAAPAPPLPGEEEPEDAEIVDEGSDDEIVDAEVIEDDDLFPEGEGPDEHLEGGPTYTGAAVIAIRLGELGVKDRDHRLRIVSAILDVEPPLETTKDLEPAEVTKVLEDLSDPELAATFIGATASEGSSPDSSRSAAKETKGAETDSIGSETEDPEKASPSGPRRRRTPDPEEWDADRWRAFLTDRKVKVSEVVKEANRLGRERELEAVPGTLDDVPGSGLAAELVGFVEDLALERGASS